MDRVGTVIVDCALYRDGQRQNAAPLALNQAAEVCSDSDGFIWLGLFEPDPEELAEVQHRFGLHELAIEDAQTFHLRPKIERYEGGVLFTVLRTVRYDEERDDVELGELSVFLSDRFVITVRQGKASELHGSDRDSRRTLSFSRREPAPFCGRSSTPSWSRTHR